MPAFLVTGGTGHQGGGAVRSLLAQNHTVHALVRDPTAPSALALRDLGAKLFKGTFEDLDSLKTAAAGTRGVFLNPNPTRSPDGTSQTSEVAQAENVLAAAKAAGTVDTIVVSTGLGAGRHAEWAAEDPDYPMAGFYGSKFGIEQAVKAAGFKYVVVLRPAWLMHNYLPPVAAFHWPGLPAERKIVTVTDPGLKVPHFDGGDVGRLAAEALIRPEEWAGREIECGSEDLSWEEVARVLTKVAGVDVKVEYVDGKVERIADLFLTWKNSHEWKEHDFNSYGVKLTTLEEYLTQRKDTLVAMMGGK